MCTNPLKITINNEEYTVKCGKCDTCRREKSQDWAIKLINEAQYHKKACFITLTFDNKILLDKNSKARKYGANPSFVFSTKYSKDYFRKFIKRLRKKFKGKRITYFAVSEYGEKTKRPHYHCIIYGINFEDDRKEGQISKSGHIQYVSETLNNLWACGRSTIEDINANNIIYISQYSLKKFKTNEDKKYRAHISFSNRSKISIKWARRNYRQIVKGYLEDKDGKKFKVPQSYKLNLKNSDKEQHRKAFLEYEQTIMERIGDITPDDMIKKQKIKEEIRRIRNESRGTKRDF